MVLCSNPIKNLTFCKFPLTVSRTIHFSRNYFLVTISPKILPNYSSCFFFKMTSWFLPFSASLSSELGMNNLSWVVHRVNITTSISVTCIQSQIFEEICIAITNFNYSCKTNINLSVQVLGHMLRWLKLKDQKW